MIIGLGHRAGVGKSTIAEMIAKNFDFVRFSFTPLVQSEVLEAYEKYGYVYRLVYPNLLVINQENIELPTNEFFQLLDATVKLASNYPDKVYHIGTAVINVGYVEDKILLQIWGTNYRRRQNENYWVEKFMNIYDPKVNYVMENIRFRNEADTIKKLGGVVAKVVLLDANGNEISLNTDNRILNHPSETDLENYDFDLIIYNYYNDLERTEKEVIEKVLGLLEKEDTNTF